MVRSFFIVLFYFDIQLIAMWVFLVVLYCRELRDFCFAGLNFGCNFAA